MFVLLPINLLALSITIMVPSSMNATPWFLSLPSFLMCTFILSPGKTTGLMAPARSFILSTPTPSSLATLLRLKSLVRTEQSSIFAMRTSLASTSFISGSLSSCIITSIPGIFFSISSISRPLLPRLRFSSSDESAICWSSCRTKRGTTSFPSKKRVSQIAEILPSIMTLVSKR